MEYEILCSVMSLNGRPGEMGALGVIASVRALERALKEHGITGAVEIRDLRAGRCIRNTVIIGDA